MISSRTSRLAVWLVAASATLLAQVVPQAACRACDQPCCAEPAGGLGPAALDACSDAAVACPLCAAAARVPPVEPNDQPCRCRLHARHDRPFALSRGSSPAVADGQPAVGTTAILPLVPPVLGVSREYLASTLAVPIRPPRILFGVWRN